MPTRGSGARPSEAWRPSATRSPTPCWPRRCPTTTRTTSSWRRATSGRSTARTPPRHSRRSLAGQARGTGRTGRGSRPSRRSAASAQHHPARFCRNSPGSAGSSADATVMSAPQPKRPWSRSDRAQRGEGHPEMSDDILPSEPEPPGPGGETPESAARPKSAESTSVVYSTRQARRVRDLLAKLAGTRRSVKLYPPGHPAIREGVAGLMKVIAAFHDEGVDVPLTFFENELLLGEQMLAEESMLFDQLIRDMSASGMNALNFMRGLTADELERALPVLAADGAAIEAMGGLQQAVERARLGHIEIGSVRAVDREHPEEAPGEGGELARESYRSALDLMRELERLVQANKVASAERVRGVVRSLVDNTINNKSALLELSGLKDYDEYTFFHSVNVAILSLALGSLVSSDRRFLNSLGVGALMHDIGKMTIDADVLNK